MISLRCRHCRLTVAEGNAIAYVCTECGGILDVDGYPLRDLSWSDVDDGEREQGIWRYARLLPVSNADSRATLHEGGTPLYPQRGHSFRFLKDETRNPTGSFKDRPVCVAVSKAHELGADTVITASSGNAAVSTAAYATVAGLKAVVLIPERTPQEKVCQMATYGARVVRVEGDYSESYALAMKVSLKAGWVNVTTTYLNPYATQGDKTIAYELHEQLSGRVPDWIAIPVGAGPLLAGIFEGYRELQLLGQVETCPRMVAVQSEGCAPIVRAYETGSDLVEAWDAPSGSASGILDPLRGYTQDGVRTLDIVRASGGGAVAVSDDQIMGAVSGLGAQGLFVEPAGAAAVAGVSKMQWAGLIGEHETVVMLVTGSGLKNLQPLIARTTEPPLVEEQHPDPVGAVLSAVEM